MPCHVEESESEARERRDAHYRHNSDVADMLCAIFSDYEGTTQGPARFYTCHPGLEAWWKEHKKRDDARRAAHSKIQEEKDIRARALEKLTPCERKALGVAK